MVSLGITLQLGWDQNEQKLCASIFEHDNAVAWTEESPMKEAALADFCADVEEALGQLLDEDSKGEGLLHGVGSGIMWALPRSIQEKLLEIGSSSKRTVPMTLRLGRHLIALPWEVLVLDDKARTLGEMFSVGRQVVLPMSCRGQISKRTVSSPVRMLIVADTERNLGVKEAKAIYELVYGMDDVRVELLCDPRRQDLIERLPNVDILHFAGEGDPGGGEMAWCLSGDERLKRHTIRSVVLDWPSLVFSNACRTNRVVKDLSGEVDGLSLDLLSRGVRHVITTVAPVPDIDEVAAFSTAFYTNLLVEHLPVGPALSAARRLTVDKGDEKKAWLRKGVAANYLHYGDPLGDLTRPQDRARRAIRGDQEKETAAEQDAISAYSIVSEIGYGSYQSVYLARKRDDAESGAEVALAVPYPQHKEQVVRQMEAFSWLKERLPEKGVPAILDVFVESGKLSIVYELAKGELLSDIVVNAPPPWPKERVLRLLQHMMTPLAAAHTAGLIHGELAPDELRLLSAPDDGDGDFVSATVLDMGLARALQRAGIRRTPPEHRAPYRAPEVWKYRGAHKDPTTDIWSLAVIAYQLLTGRFPFGEIPGSEDDEWRDTLLTMTPMPPELHVAELPPLLGMVLGRALSVNTEERFQSVAAFVSAFANALATSPRVGGFMPDMEAYLEAQMPTRIPVVYIDSDDEHDALERLNRIAKRQEQEIHVWSVTQGLSRGIEFDDPVMPPPQLGDAAPMVPLRWLLSSKRNTPTLLVLLDYHAYLSPPLASMHPQVQRLLRETAHTFRPHGAPRHTVVILAPEISIPASLVKDIVVFGHLAAFMDDVEEILEKTVPDLVDAPESAPAVQNISWLAAGMTRAEIGRAVDRALLQGETAIETAIEENIKSFKARAIKRQGLLEITYPEETMEDVVGCPNLKAWYATIRPLFEEPGNLGSLPAPKGVLLAGQPGCGKSFAARTVAGSLKWPLLRMDLGLLLGRQLGQSEENMREALSIAAQMSPIVMLVDDMDRNLASAADGGGSGTFQRVMHTFLHWLQERTEFTLLAATATSPASLPGELLRSGRFDERFFMDLPLREERTAVIAQTLERYNRSADAFDLNDLGASTLGFSHSDLEERVRTALYSAAEAGRTSPTYRELEAALIGDPNIEDLLETKLAKADEIVDSWRGIVRKA